MLRELLDGYLVRNPELAPQKLFSLIISFAASWWTLKVRSPQVSDFGIDSCRSHQHAAIFSPIPTRFYVPYSTITTPVIINHWWCWNTQNLVPPINSLILQVCQPFWYWFLPVVVISVPLANSMRRTIMTRSSISLFHDAQRRLSLPNRLNIFVAVQYTENLVSGNIKLIFKVRPLFWYQFLLWVVQYFRLHSVQWNFGHIRFNTLFLRKSI